MSTLTPMMKQYHALKKQCPDAILFYRMGDFYEMFYEDAIVASKILGIALTSRDKKKEGAVPLCGIPHHSAKMYLGRLIKQGKKVAVCEQMEDPKKAKGIVKRDIVRIITPGMVLDENLLEDSSNHFLVAVTRNGNLTALAALDLSTGVFNATQFESDPEKLLAELTRYDPREIILPQKMESDAQFTSHAPITFLDDWVFETESAYQRLTDTFQITSLEGFGCEQQPGVISAAGGILYYTQSTQKVPADHIRTLHTYSLSDYMYLDEATQRNLELVRSAFDGKLTNSLLDTIDRTNTAMGARLLKTWLVNPLVDPQPIRARLDAVEDFIVNGIERTEVRKTLKNIADMERLTARICMGQASARDLLQLRNTLHSLSPLPENLTPFTSAMVREIASGLDLLEDVAGLIQSSIRDEAPAGLKDGGIISDSYNDMVDELRTISRDSKGFIAALENTERKKTGISSLKVKFNKVFGYYIEVTKANLAQVPEDYIRKQTLTNAERYITPDLKIYEEKVLGAEEKLCALEYDLFEEIRRRVAAQAERLQKTAHNLAHLDVLSSWGDLAVDFNYIKPQIEEGTELLIRGGRHPVLEQRTDRFVPNDIEMDLEKNRLMIITGPNMAGKSTYLRQTALIVLMAQVGCYVPASEAQIGVVDRIFTRVGASDNLVRGQSTFMVEMTETANILNNATPKSLIILDEIGRGTSTYDGLSIAWAVAEYLNSPQHIGAKTLFATHYHELTDLAMEMEGVSNYNIAVKEYNDEIVFLYQINPGGADRSYGIEVARLAGLPREVIDRAKEILMNLEKNELNDQGEPSFAASKNKKDDDKPFQQMSLFAPAKPNPVLDEIQELDLNNLTPVDALNKLSEIQKKLLKP